MAGLYLIVLAFCVFGSEGSLGNRRLYTSLPSVSDDHYSELSSDGTYRYAYTGDNRYAAEKRFADGTVEGETLYIRPDGVPVKVTYYADAKSGYRPKTEVIYSERVVQAKSPEVVHVVREVPPPVLVAPAPVGGASHVRLRSNQAEGNQVDIGTFNGGDVAAALPSVTAIVGPGGHADIRPHAVARTGDGGRFRSLSGRGGDVAIANPSATAIVGPGGSVHVAPVAKAYTGGASEHESDSPAGYRYKVPVKYEVPVPVEIPVPVHVPVRVPVEVRTPVRVIPARRVVQQAIHADGVVIVPPQPSYSYTYSYSAPDGKHPERDNKAFVAVQVNN